jgi:phosphocarrier protein HPr
MIEIELTVRNRAGIHTRPAASIVKLAARFQSDVFLVKDGFEINAKSIIGVMTLAADQGSTLILKVKGSDEEKATDEIKSLFDMGFDEL